MTKFLTLTANSTILGQVLAQPVGLDIISGDFVDEIGDVTITRSDATMLSISNAALGTTAKEIAFRQYAAKQWLTFDVATLRAPEVGEAHWIDISYTTDQGTKKTDRLNVVVKRADNVAEIQDGTGAAAGFASILDYLTVTAATNLDNIRVKAATEVDAEADLGIIPGETSEAANNTTKLQSYFAANATNRQPPIGFGVKPYYLSGALHNGNDAGYRSFRMFGRAGSEYASQHQENPRTVQASSRLIIQGLTGSNPWFRITGSEAEATQPGMIRFEDLTFEIPTGHTGSVLEFGDPDSTMANDNAIVRGAHVRGCYFTHKDLLSTGWLTDLRINPARNFAIRCTKAYDVSVIECGFRGFAEQIVLRNCDRMLVENTHHFHCLRAIVAAPAASFATARGVPGVFINNYCETPLVTGFVIGAGQVTNVRCEVGYDDVIEPNQDLFNLPSGMAWSISAGTGVISLTGIPTGRTAGDYFMPHMVVKATPTQTYNPPRWYYLTEVAETGTGTGTLTFANSATQSYTKETISGGNTALQRPMPLPMILAGDRTSLNEFSLGFNHDRDVPYLVLAPINTTMTVVGGTSTGAGPNPSNLNQLPQIVGHCCGTQFNVHTGVAWYGQERGPNHPLAEVFTPAWNANHRPSILAPSTGGKFDLFCKPGRGINVANNPSRDLQFHPLTEVDGSTVFAYKMNQASNSPAGPWIPPGFQSGRRYRYTARCYVDAAMSASSPGGVNVFSIWDGTTSHDHAVQVAVGWHTFRGRSGAAPTAFQITHNRNVFVSWVGIEYIEDNQAYTVTNLATDRSFDANTAADAELADVLGTLIADLRAKGIVD